MRRRMSSLRDGRLDDIVNKAVSVKDKQCQANKFRLVPLAWWLSELAGHCHTGIFKLGSHGAALFVKVECINNEVGQEGVSLSLRLTSFSKLISPWLILKIY